MTEFHVHHRMQCTLNVEHYCRHTALTYDCVAIFSQSKATWWQLEMCNVEKKPKWKIENRFKTVINERQTIDWTGFIVIRLCLVFTNKPKYHQIQHSTDNYTLCHLNSCFFFFLLVSLSQFALLSKQYCQSYKKKLHV